MKELFKETVAIVGGIFLVISLAIPVFPVLIKLTIKLLDYLDVIL